MTTFCNLRRVPLLLLTLYCSKIEASTTKRMVGWAYDPNSNGFFDGAVEIETFLDLQCSDSQKAWNIFKEVANYYDRKVKVRMVGFPLPYIRGSYKAAVGFQVIGSRMAPFDFVDLMFEYRRNIKSYAKTVNDDQLVNYIANLTSTYLNVDHEDFVINMNAKVMDRKARADWKYACSLGTYGTPTTYVNGEFFGDDSIAGYTLDDWKKVLDPLVENTF